MITAIDREKCIGCGKCTNTCPLDTLRMEDGKAIIAHPEDCMTCFQCEMVCPAEAIYVHPYKELLPRSLPFMF
ncbi:ferredoxin family protein [Peptococcus simiae]|uniref:4Fe-4S dicluster domain-containing protein n=1 Tax=Peptococcus simiae TaxID=1643805 RepID=UPI0039812CF4